MTGPGRNGAGFDDMDDDSARIRKCATTTRTTSSGGDKARDPLSRVTVNTVEFRITVTRGRQEPTQDSAYVVVVAGKYLRKAFYDLNVL